MSRVMKVLDARLVTADTDKITYVVPEGCQNVNYTPLPATSQSNTNAVFNLSNIGSAVARDPRLAVGIQVTATLQVINNTASPATFYQGNLGLKQYPLNRVINNLQHQINNASTSLNLADIVDAITKSNVTPHHLNFYNNTAPDVFDSYENSAGNAMSPLNDWADSLNGDGVYKNRTAGITITGNDLIVSASPQTVTITTTLYEPLLSPFANVSDKNDQALWNINGEVITLFFVNDLWNRMFAYYDTPDVTLSSASVVLGNATLYTILLTPQPSFRVPESTVTPYADFSVFTQSYPAGCPKKQSLGGGNISTPVCQFPVVPSKILVYAKLNTTSQTSATPDKYLTIRSLQCTINSGSPQLSGASQNQLFDVSYRNGLRQPRPVWRSDVLTNVNDVSPVYGCGGPMVIDPALDLGLIAESTSSKGRTIFQATNIDFYNATDIDFANVTVYVIAITPGALVRNGSQYQNYLVTLPDDVVELAELAPAMAHDEYLQAKAKNLFMSGSGWKDWLSKTVDTIKQAVPYVQKGVELAMKHKAPIMSAVSQGRKLLGIGEGMRYSRLRSRRMKGRGEDELDEI